MKKSAKLAFGLFIVISTLFAAATQSPNRNALASQDQFISCPASLVAPYGGSDGWSTIQVQANFAHALVSPQGLMTCQYGFGAQPVKPFFGIQKRCPQGFQCVAERNGFGVRPTIR
jgi:hypothetical protein